MKKENKNESFDSKSKKTYTSMSDFDIDTISASDIDIKKLRNMVSDSDIVITQDDIIKTKPTTEYTTISKKDKRTSVRNTLSTTATTTSKLQDIISNSALFATFDDESDIIAYQDSRNKKIYLVINGKIEKEYSNAESFDVNCKRDVETALRNSASSKSTTIKATKKTTSTTLSKLDYIVQNCYKHVLSSNEIIIYAEKDSDKAYAVKDNEIIEVIDNIRLIEARMHPDPDCEEQYKNSDEDGNNYNYDENFNYYDYCDRFLEENRSYVNINDYVTYTEDPELETTTTTLNYDYTNNIKDTQQYVSNTDTKTYKKTR